MRSAYKGLVPVLPLVPQVFLTAWTLLAPYLVLTTALAPLVSFWLLPIGFLALLWCVLDPIGRQCLSPVRGVACKTGVYGGADIVQLRARRCAIQRLAKTYKPTPWLLSGDQRTLAVVLSGRQSCDALQQHRVDGCRGKLLVHWRPSKGAPIVCVVGGIVGDPDSPFIRDMQHATKERGLGFGIWVTRPDLLVGNLSSAPNPADVRDIHSILEWVRLQVGVSPIYLVGYSMGASMVLLYCARYGTQAVCDAVAAVSGSFTPLPLYCPHYRRYWQPWLTAQLKLLFYERFAKELPPKAEVAAATCYVELIDRLPHVGPVSKLCAGGDAFAERHGICRPVLFFASADDPFHHPVEGLGIDESLPWVLHYITEVGGHVGWPEGMFADCGTFQTRVVLGFLESSS